MKTGFYDIDKLSDNKLKSFFKDALAVSYKSDVHILDCNKSWRRMVTDDFSVDEMINLSKSTNHNICIDRSYQHPGLMDNAEIGYATVGDPSYFLYIFTSLTDLDMLTKKYNLKLKEI